MEDAVGFIRANLLEVRVYDDWRRTELLLLGKVDQVLEDPLQGFSAFAFNGKGLLSP